MGVTHIDSEGFLWLEEYPYPKHNKFVLNGHIFAALGVYEYWRLTESEEAKSVFSGAIATVMRYLSVFRNPSWSSHYDLRSRLLIRNYHATHISQLEHLYRITGDNFFSRFADTFEHDFPFYQRHGSMYLASGSHLAAVADNSRVPTKALEFKEVELKDAIAIPFVARTKIEQESGVWLYVEEDGPYKGLWFRESPPKVFPKLCLDRREYPRPRKLIVKGNTLTLNGFNQSGNPVESRIVTTSPGDRFDILAKALWNGVWFVLVKAEGSLQFSWHKLSADEAIVI